MLPKQPHKALYRIESPAKEDMEMEEIEQDSDKETPDDIEPSIVYMEQDQVSDRDEYDIEDIEDIEDVEEDELKESDIEDQQDMEFGFDEVACTPGGVLYCADTSKQIPEWINNNNKPTTSTIHKDPIARRYSPDLGEELDDSNREYSPPTKRRTTAAVEVGEKTARDRCRESGDRDDLAAASPQNAKARPGMSDSVAAGWLITSPTAEDTDSDSSSDSSGGEILWGAQPPRPMTPKAHTPQRPTPSSRSAPRPDKSKSQGGRSAAKHGSGNAGVTDPTDKGTLFGCFDLSFSSSSVSETPSRVPSSKKPLKLYVPELHTAPHDTPILGGSDCAPRPRPTPRPIGSSKASSSVAKADRPKGKVNLNRAHYSTALINLFDR